MQMCIRDRDMLLKTDQNSTHLKYFNACISYDGDYDLSNKTVEITLKNLTEEGDYDTTVITDGTWDFKWTLGAVNLPTTLEVNRKCNFGGYEITVKKMEVCLLYTSCSSDRSYRREHEHQKICSGYRRERFRCFLHTYGR